MTIADAVDAAARNKQKRPHDADRRLVKFQFRRGRGAECKTGGRRNARLPPALCARVAKERLKSGVCLVEDVHRLDFGKIIHDCM